ncbi:MAG: glycerol kinase GlpK [Desulfobacula sp.]|jgi:glycerol kinase|uniref:glycerol kinase GlpK n=1 Tax=Desulfobacula sp. TaxID=2593537 RepID=UPI001DBF67F6|nr:glycerol kinase GlpK [Desulfobacula sp.]MBT3487233.1 glycerol kinase GlpK [Desulfobacula sp.]MBT3806816.1 glycerol kinase GlpK [Desulfobacula sp.]MBT4027124.1 glycerol kinase GlpK [Desulfobacula sp.]MBT4200858.1 glycerol kinase GlpK [Desulfobacula sp.]
MSKYVGSIDLGTTSIRFILFDKQGNIFGSAQKEHRQIFPKPGWVEHDPIEIWENTFSVIAEVMDKTCVPFKLIDSIGITNQRETSVVWNKKTGKPYYNAIVWQCTRTDEICKNLEAETGGAFFSKKTGLPLATYFSGPKVKWVLDNILESKKDLFSGDVLFGTIETWIIWWLTGGPEKGSHITDVSNASRTMMMNIHSLEWDNDLLGALGIPISILPEIKPSIDSNTWGRTLKEGPFKGEIPVCGALGDQQAALFGQTCFSKGEAKNTYGTGCFLLMNTGNTPVISRHGLLTTVGYQINNEKAVYCLEGSIAIAGALVQWMRDNLGIIKSAAEIEDLAKTVDDNGDVYFVPAFSGLFAPYWRSDARGIIAGLTGFVNKGHLARAAIEASAYQTRDIITAMKKDSMVDLTRLKVDGGMVLNELLMQFQSDILNVPIIRPIVIETTALGAAYAAGLATGFWSDIEDLKKNWSEGKTWLPSMDRKICEDLYSRWGKAIERSFDWV